MPIELSVSRVDIPGRREPLFGQVVHDLLVIDDRQTEPCDYLGATTGMVGAANTSTSSKARLKPP